MQRILFKFALLAGILQTQIHSVEAFSFEKNRKQQMINDLKVVKHHYETGYAPLEWKKKYWGFDIDEAYKEAKNKILSTPAITVKQFQQILRVFVNSMKDYHVDVSFYSTEAASLPFGVKGVDGRYFVDWVDPLRMPPSHFRVSVGDEVLFFDEKPVAQLIEEIKKEGGKFSNPETDDALAEVRLTRRTGMAGDIVPQGSLLITFESAKTQKNYTYQLRWLYQPERVTSPSDIFQSLNHLKSACNDYQNMWVPSDLIKAEMTKIKMLNPIQEQEAYQSGGPKNRKLGGRKSFVPSLGEVIWKFNEKLDLQEWGVNGGAIDWLAYIYQHADGRNVGYIRIPHYMGDESDTQVFGKILEHMEKETEALVIDQLHNFGGYVDFQYQLASILVKDEPFTSPYHRIKITQKDVLDAYQVLRMFDIFESTFINQRNLLKFAAEDSYDDNKDDIPNISDSETSSSLEEEANHQWLLHVKAYFEFIISEWNAGRTLTNPSPILGVDRINPHPKFHYTKPILMLINEMDFSGGDFMPAILRDNNRAVLFGSRTAGAGGYVFTFQFPNSSGVASCSYTASIAERTNGQKIENLGVEPDVKYTLTVDDVQYNYQGYVQAVNEAVSGLYKTSEIKN